MKTLFDYHEAAEFTDLSPAYVKRLCDQHKIGYVVKEYRRGCGRYRRLKRYIPQGEIVRTCSDGLHAGSSRPSSTT